MRFKGFMRKFLGGGIAEFCGFQSEHFKEAGLMPMPAAGMPVLEAHELVNKWNMGQTDPRFMYWLERQ